MILYFVGIFVLGAFVGICARNNQIKRAAKNGTVITIDGEMYSIKKESRKRDPGGAR